jgi:hypothetical protein
MKGYGCMSFVGGLCNIFDQFECPEGSKIGDKI